MNIKTKIRQNLSEARLNIKSLLRKKKLSRSIDKSFVAHFNKTVNCTSTWYGNSYGGFFVNPDIINNSSIVYSFGIGKDISFDKEMINAHNCKVFAFDPTPQSINWLSSQDLPQGYEYFKYGISTRNEIQKFYLPLNPRGVSGSLVNHIDTNLNDSIEVNMKNFLSITHELAHSHINLIKMDIEGFEYEVVEDILDSGVSFDQILIEFHDRYFDDKIMKSKKTVESLNKRGYKLFACSISFEEASFIHESLL